MGRFRLFSLLLLSASLSGCKSFRDLFSAHADVAAEAIDPLTAANLYIALAHRRSPSLFTYTISRATQRSVAVLSDGNATAPVKVGREPCGPCNRGAKDAKPEMAGRHRNRPTAP